MYKQIAYCPNCNVKRELDISLGMVTYNNIEGTHDILLYHYHCASCNSYVRSTTMNHDEYISSDEIVGFSIPEYIQRLS